MKFEIQIIKAQTVPLTQNLPSQYIPAFGLVVMYDVLQKIGNDAC